MAETNVYKVLYQGQLPSSIGTLATVGGGKGWIIRNMTVVKTGATSRTYSLYINGTAAANRITPLNCALATEEMDVYDDMICLNDGDTLVGLASAATELTLTVTGDEVTL